MLTFNGGDVNGIPFNQVTLTVSQMSAADC